MSLAISVHANHILVESDSGLNYWEILEAVFNVSPGNGYPDTNQIWVFRDGPTSLVFDDLYQLKDVIVLNYPDGGRRKKLAIVAESGFHYSVAQTFAQIASDLACSIRVFPDLHSARNWVAEATTPLERPADLLPSWSR